MTEMSGSCLITFYGADGVSECRGTVLLTEAAIQLEYTWGGVRTTYGGAEVGDGHYRLASGGEGGENTMQLHRFPGDTLLVGTWSEARNQFGDSGQGLLSIRLGTE